eukprot:2222455-Amphidinium_carterae.1
MEDVVSQACPKNTHAPKQSAWNAKVTRHGITGVAINLPTTWRSRSLMSYLEALDNADPKTGSATVVNKAVSIETD